mmetsp:Transcript_13322/g.21779  ORF Transcript_13322/g.21779 Transcript_13322/m.21779 type:complete len:84 (-) Transcript_13322:2966-3217(-)
MQLWFSRTCKCFRAKLAKFFEKFQCILVAGFSLLEYLSGGRLYGKGSTTSAVGRESLHKLCVTYCLVLVDLKSTPISYESIFR